MILCSDFIFHLFAQTQGLTFLLHPLHGALYEESCFSMLEDLSTFFGSKGMRQSGQRGDVTCRHGCRQSPQKSVNTQTQTYYRSILKFSLIFVYNIHHFYVFVLKRDS